MKNRVTVNLNEIEFDKNKTAGKKSQILILYLVDISATQNL